jgi:multidrug efflux pump
VPQDDLSDYRRLEDPGRRSAACRASATQVFGTQYAMRIWLDPLQAASLRLMP